jgi:hypothetical protein
MYAGCVTGTALPSMLLSKILIGAGVNPRRSFLQVRMLKLLHMKLREGCLINMFRDMKPHLPSAVVTSAAVAVLITSFVGMTERSALAYADAVAAAYGCHRLFLCESA